VVLVRHGATLALEPAPSMPDFESPPPRHRRCLVRRGSAERTREAALAAVAGLDPAQVLWLGEAGEQERFETIEPRRVQRALGRSLDAVVIDAHHGLEPDVLGAAHGLVRGGGALVLRMPGAGALLSPRGQARLAVEPFGLDDVGTRFHRHVERVLAGAGLDEPAPLTPAPLTPAPRPIEGHAEQAELVERLRERWAGPGPSRVVLLADRGRGKSSALGLALAEGSDRPPRVAVTGPAPEAVAEVFRFATGDPQVTHAGALRFVPLPELVFGPERFELIVVDEAAQLPVPMLRGLVERHGAAHLAFATTTHGYEGTGRGFVLRFLEGLEAGPVQVWRETLHRPIRWDEGDPLERLVFDALLLDAEPANHLELGLDVREEVTARRLDRDQLLHDEATLRELFGLLVHAHYRTTPGDLHRLLDAPNLGVHVLSLRGHVVAATIVAREGGLSPERCEAMLSGTERIRAHALADALVAHLGHAEAGGLEMVRSVRIATHPALRRRGLARRLVEHVHEQYAPALFGTMFGVTPELLAFRRSLGYRLVRLSASRGARTGEPSAMMLRPVSARSHALVEALRAELARDLPRQLELLQADEQTLLEPALVVSLHEGLPWPAPLSVAQRDALVSAYAHGPRTFESVALAVLRFVRAHPERLDRLGPPERALVEGRAVAGHGWHRVAADAGMSVPAAMRGLRRAVRSLVPADGT